MTKPARKEPNYLIQSDTELTQKAHAKLTRKNFVNNTCLIIFGVSTLILGVGVGILVSLLIPSQSILLKLVVFFLILGMITLVNILYGRRLSSNHTVETQNALTLIDTTLQSIDYALIVVNLKLEVQYFNKQFLSLWDLSAIALQKPLSGHNIAILKNQLAEPDVFEHGVYYYRVNLKEEFTDELRLADGRVLERFSKPYGLDKEVIGHVWGYRDVTQKKQMEQNINFQVNHDILTRLPNRSLLRDRLEHDLEIAKRFRSQLAVMYIGLDHFKEINDLVGHQKGDVILQTIAKRLQNCIRKSDTVARFGGDEFIILFLTKVRREMLDLCNKILQVVALPISLDNEELHLSASIGVSLYPHDGLEGAVLIKNADMAMNLAKKEGRNHFRMFDDISSSQAIRHQEIQQQLVNAVNRQEFSLMYQPIVSVETHEILAAEALLRWNNPVLGKVNPVEFIAIAEEMGVTIPLSEWVIRRVCQDYSRWQEAGKFNIKIAINISSMQLQRSHLVKLFNKILAEYHLHTECITIELTETNLMDSSSSILNKLKEVSNLGIEIAIDDFGTGYASFRYLTEFPVTRLKIDKSLIQKCHNNTKIISVVKAIVTMCRQLHIKVIAEGVETLEHLQAIRECGCDEMQGFLISSALPADDLLVFYLNTANNVRHPHANEINKICSISKRQSRNLD